jgi:predicted Zn-dependent peptidase
MVALKDKLVPLKELEKAKEFLKGKIILEIEDSFALAELIGLQALLNKKTRTPKEIFAEIDKVSAEDIRQVAQEIFVDSKLNLAVISPKVNINSLRKILKF